MTVIRVRGVRLTRNIMRSRGSRFAHTHEEASELSLPRKSSRSISDIPAGKRVGLTRLIGIVLHPWNLLLPIDHQHIFKTAVGAAKGHRFGAGCS